MKASLGRLASLVRGEPDARPAAIHRQDARISGSHDPYRRRLDLAALPAPEDTDLAKQLTRFPEVVAKAAAEREPHRVTVYLEELAGVIHGWYHRTRTVGEPPPVEQARLLLARAARIVVANGLTLLGLSAPDRM